MQYKNTQLGVAMLTVLGLALLLLVISSISKPNESIIFAFLIVGVLAILFSTLTIKVEEGKVSWFFGPRFWRKSVDLSQIESAKVIRTKWYYGLGVRLIPSGWLYNVSGLSAVELRLKDGKTVSLGTNDPDNLLKVIKQNI